MTFPLIDAAAGAATFAANVPAPSGHWVHDLDPVALDLGFFQLRWYSLGYLAGILLGYLYLLRLIKQPGAPMARRHADDFVFYVTMGIIFGGRLGYVLFYQPAFYLENPLKILQLWDGGMSFHGGLIGSTLAVVYLAWRNGLSFLRVADYACICGPFGLFFVRCANFVNGELWGHATDVSWAVIFPSGGMVPRHPSQLYEAFLEGIVLFAVLWTLFWYTRARYKPGMLAGVFLLGYGLARFTVEFFRMPDAHLSDLPAQTGLSMGQWLTVPMLLLGLYMIVTSRRRDPIMVTQNGKAVVAPRAGDPPAWGDEPLGDGTDPA